MIKVDNIKLFEITKSAKTIFNKDDCVRVKNFDINILYIPIKILGCRYDDTTYIPKHRPI